MILPLMTHAGDGYAPEFTVEQLQNPRFGIAIALLSKVQKVRNVIRL
jgi:hypothetical protein